MTKNLESEIIQHQCNSFSEKHWSMKTYYIKTPDAMEIKITLNSPNNKTYHFSDPDKYVISRQLAKLWMSYYSKQSCA